MLENNTIELRRTCPICCGKHGIVYRSIHFEVQEGNPLPTEYRIVRCSSCGFDFADMVATQELFNKYYSKFNVYSEMEYLRKRVRNDYVRTIEFLNLLDKDISILDIGCGGGGLLCELNENGFSNITGCDPSSKSIANIISKGFKGFVANIFDKIQEERKHSYDVVVSLAVIEHIFDIHNYVKQLLKYVKRGGYIIINAPASEGFAEFITPLPNCFNQEHINYFNAMSLDKLFGLYGLRRLNEDPYVENNHMKQLIMIYSIQNEQIDICIRNNSYLVDYFKKIDEFDKERKSFIEKIITQNKKVVIFGTGSYTMQLLANFPQIKKNILFYSDNNSNKWGLTLDNKKVCAPDKILEVNGDVLILICSMLNSEDIFKQLENLGIKNNIVIMH